MKQILTFLCVLLVSNILGQSKPVAQWSFEMGSQLATLSKSADPLFINPAVGDFKLKTGSPAIDFGAGLLYFPKKDLFGNTRPKGKETDSGAYEIE